MPGLVLAGFLTLESLYLFVFGKHLIIFSAVFTSIILFYFLCDYFVITKEMGVLGAAYA